MVWKVLVKVYLLMGESLTWKTSRGGKIKTGECPWMGCLGNYLLLVSMKLVLYSLEIYSLVDVVDRRITP